MSDEAESKPDLGIAPFALEAAAATHERRAEGLRALIADWEKLSEASRYEIHQLLQRASR